jgi:hypothetical protein
VKVFKSTTEPLENVPVITINILFENTSGIEKLELNQSAQFGYFNFIYVDNEFKKI